VLEPRLHQPLVRVAARVHRAHLPPRPGPARPGVARPGQVRVRGVKRARDGRYGSCRWPVAARAGTGTSRTFAARMALSVVGRWRYGSCRCGSRARLTIARSFDYRALVCALVRLRLVPLLTDGRGMGRPCDGRSVHMAGIDRSVYDQSV
jgi:hypothetical protein